MPGEILLRFLELTEARPEWLLHGTGPPYWYAADPVEAKLVLALRAYIDARGGGREILPPVS